MSSMAASVTTEQVQAFAAQRLTWHYDGQRFMSETKHGNTCYVGFTLSRKWVPSRRNHRFVNEREDWVGPAFDDPITALVHAETCDWGRA